MEPYLVLFGLGFTGLSLMALLGALGGPHDGHGTHGHHAEIGHLHGHAGGHGHALGHGHAHAGHANGGHVQAGGHAHGHHGELPAHHTPHPHHDGSGTRPALANVSRGSATNLAPDDDFDWKNAALAWLSPRVVFTLALGAGATGLLLAPYLPFEPFRGLVSLAGGVGLEKLAVGPVWNAMMKFVSNPARTLESAVLEEAVALTNFDRDGCGLVSIDLDGHEMRVLGRLVPEERAERVLAGQTLLVESVDAVREQCVVRRTAK